MKSKILIIVFCICLLVVALLAVRSSSPRHKQPEYSVNTYEELAETIAGQCALPAKESLPQTNVTYTICLESRFSDEVIGYIIGYSTAETGAAGMTISCKALNAMDDVSGLSPTEVYKQVGLEITENGVSFAVSGYQYVIYHNTISEELQQTAIKIAESIIDNSAK